MSGPFPGVDRSQLASSSAMRAMGFYIPNVTAVDTDYVLDATDGVFASGTGDGEFAAQGDLTLAYLPDFGRNLTMLLTDNADADLSVDVTVKGRDQFGLEIEELFSGGAISLPSRTYSTFAPRNRPLVTSVCSSKFPP